MMDYLCGAALVLVFFPVGAVLVLVGMQYGPAIFNAIHRRNMRRWERKQ